MKPTDLPLPDYAYVPGSNQRHPEGFLDSIIHLAPQVTVSAGADTNLAWMFGLRLLREGYFWETHEVLEPVWLNAQPNSREKHLVQAIIHAANAALKIKMGRQDAARRLSGLAKEAAQEAFSGGDARRVMGLASKNVFRISNECAHPDCPFYEL